MTKKRKKTYKSPVFCWNSKWEITYENKNTENTEDKAPKPIHTLIVGKTIQNNNK